MTRALTFVLILCGLQSPVAALAQTDISEASVAVLDRLDDALMGVGDHPLDRYLAYADIKEDFRAASAADEMLPLGFAVTNIALASDVRANYAQSGLEWARLGTGPIETTEGALAFLMAAYFSPESTPPTHKQLYKMGEALDRLNAAGMSLEELGIHATPAMLGWMENAIKVFKAGLGAADLADDDDAEIDQIVRDLADLVPVAMGPAINGPAIAAFADVMDWNGELWDASTEGLDLISDAIERGELDQERYAAVAERIETLSGQGPWDGDTAREFLKKWAESLPGVGKLIKAVWPEPLPEQCGPITCDCDNLDFGILTGPYQDECRAAERSLIKQCRIDKSQGACHPTASGPGAYTPS
jgi:hypothetical protein